MAFMMQNEVLLDASPEEVWMAINDAELLKLSIPGCESLERGEDGAFNATVKLKIGPISARFKGVVRFVDVDAPASCRIVGEGQGGIAGFAKGGARIRLTPAGGATRLSYEVEAEIGGKIAQLGSRLIDGVAKKLSEQFFQNFSKTFSASSGRSAA
ncbi:carbon monoxide dehydrogenase subunit G [Mesorhizobium sp. LHD-90]|uniref:CoxG family protein n=1 Tax=Mesorhizobium sp. LHD-90 TaxID=3071414 RepID=UPI0027E14E73|nr:carbon monoxide dehydrogenase subunit G [Mesorhizobium sp. LHD-90]MDQ6432533.1 carbon monoxide dehydrogenase subunit G [Mesorhizobium sp. LHD-90]